MKVSGPHMHCVNCKGKMQLIGLSQMRSLSVVLGPDTDDDDH